MTTNNEFEGVDPTEEMEGQHIPVLFEDSIPTDWEQLGMTTDEVETFIEEQTQRLNDEFNEALFAGSTPSVADRDVDAEVVLLCQSCYKAGVCAAVCLPLPFSQLDEWVEGPQVQCVTCNGWSDRSSCILDGVDADEEEDGETINQSF